VGHHRAHGRAHHAPAGRAARQHGARGSGRGR
jgi:hypothetical protein